MKKLAQNKEARFHYDILDILEAGMVLAGHEVKSAKKGNVSLKGAYVTIRNQEAFLVNAHIKKYEHAGDMPQYDPTRDRKLLLKKKEISTLIGKSKEQGLTLVPLEMVIRKGLVKLVVGIGRGKKKYDKRENIKKREADRKIQRAIKKRL